MSFNNSITIQNHDKWPTSVVIHTDGASRGNPGPASLGLTVTSNEGEVVFEYAEFLGEQTNNYAEYSAVKKALQLAIENQVQFVHIKSDSQFLIRQLLGEYKVKSESIKGLYTDCVALIEKLPQVDLEHVRREQNKRADELANQVLDKR